MEKKNKRPDFEKVIYCVGRTVTAHLSDGWSSPPYRALIQPLRYKNKMYIEGEYTPIGQNRDGFYLYIGPASHDISKLSEDAYIRAGDSVYKIDRAERCYFEDEVSHVWAILRSVEAST